MLLVRDMAAYTDNRAEATETALDADLVGGAVRQFMAKRDEWTGPATELWEALNRLVGEEVRQSKAWPGAPNALTKSLKRLAPALRDVGIEYSEPSRVGKSGSRTKKLRKIEPAKDRQQYGASHNSDPLCIADVLPRSQFPRFAEPDSEPETLRKFHYRNLM